MGLRYAIWHFLVFPFTLSNVKNQYVDESTTQRLSVTDCVKSNIKEWAHIQRHSSSKGDGKRQSAAKRNPVLQGMLHT